MAEVGQRYQRISTELGLAQESQVRELMRHFAGKQVDGSLFSLEGALTLPHFASVAPHQTLDMELDAVAETCTEPGRSNDERWAVEIKWRNEPAIRKELEAFWHNARTIGGHPLRLWFIARAGFRYFGYAQYKDSALRFGREQGILLSS